MKTGGHKGILCVYLLSLPVRGAWIEMQACACAYGGFQSLPVRGAWIEMWKRRLIILALMSLPVRGAWIEITPITGSATGTVRRSL